MTTDLKQPAIQVIKEQAHMSNLCNLRPTLFFILLAIDGLWSTNSNKVTLFCLVHSSISCLFSLYTTKLWARNDRLVEGFILQSSIPFFLVSSADDCVAPVRYTALDSFVMSYMMTITSLSTKGPQLDTCGWCALEQVFLRCTKGRFIVCANLRHLLISARCWLLCNWLSHTPRMDILPMFWGLLLYFVCMASRAFLLATGISSRAVMHILLPSWVWRPRRIPLVSVARHFEGTYSLQ